MTRLIARDELREEDITGRTQNDRPDMTKRGKERGIGGEEEVEEEKEAI
jgi:hypothetical protein